MSGNFKEEFHRRLVASFLPEDADDLQDLWEEIAPQLDWLIEAGESEKAIIENLGAPEEIAKEFYQDRNLEIVVQTDRSVIPAEEAADYYKYKRRKKWLDQLHVLSVMGKRLVVLLFILCQCYALVYFLYEALWEQHISFALVTASISLAVICFQLIRSKRTGLGKWLPAVGAVIIGGCVWLFLNQQNLLFYAGTNAAHTFTVPQNELKKIQIQTNVPLTIRTVPSSQSELKFEVTGKSARTVLSQIKDAQVSGGSYQLDLSVFKPFTLLSEDNYLELMIRVPRDYELADISYKVSDGHIELQQIKVKELDVTAEKGSVLLNRITSGKADIQLTDADFIAQNSQSAKTEIRTKTGKVILKDQLEEQLYIQSADGFISLQKIKGSKVNTTNQTGKTLVVDGEIGSLNASSQTGELLVMGQDGKTHLTSRSGKIVAERMKGSLQGENNYGDTIITQDHSLTGEVKSQSGLIKWIQTDLADMSFKITTKSGKTENDFTYDKSLPYQMLVSNERGYTKIIRQEE